MLALLRIRSRERLLLALVGAVLLLGVAALKRGRPATPDDAWAIAISFCAALAIVHIALAALAPRSDQTLLPMATMLAAIGIIFVLRLEPDLATKQLLWNGLGMASLTVALPLLQDVHRLRHYQYLAAGLGLGLMLVTAMVGKEINGSRLWLGAGGFYFQVTEAMKVLLIVFLAGYLADRRLLLSATGRRWRGVRLPTLPYLVPMGLIWVLTFLVLIWQRDLGATVLFAGLTLLLLYVVSGKISFVTAGIVLVVVDVFAAYHLFGYVRQRVDIWLHPFADADAGGYQIAQALYGISAGSVLGAGLGRGFPGYIPAVHTDFVFAAIAEELGMVGGFAIIILYLLLVFTGLRLALAQQTDFTALLALGCTAIFALQALVIVAGNLALIPVTGITLPFISYGGSSILVNYLLIAVLLRLSTRARSAGA